MLKSLAFISLLSLFISCAKEKRQVSIQQVELGDPMNIVRGTTLNPTFSNAEEFQKKLSDFTLLARHTFMERREIDEQDKNIYAQNFLGGSHSYDEPRSISKRGDKFLWTHNDAGYGLGDFQFEVQKDKSIKPTFLLIDRERIPIKSLHLSINKEETAFSMLIYFNIPDFGDVVAYYLFAKDFKEKKIFSKEKYKFLQESNQKIRWQKPNSLELSFCGKNNDIEKIEYPVYLATETWNDVSGNLYNISLKPSKRKYPPFSDLNLQCIYVIKDYRTRGGEVVNPAAAFMAMNPSSNSIIDGDIVFYEDEIKKNIPRLDESPVFPSYIKSVTQHEIGHFLGLGHEFDEEIDSIMSYDYFFISDHDKEAIQELYR